MAELSNLDLIDAIDNVLLTTLSIARDISDADAHRPTSCPGWTVHDQLAHMVGLEQVLQGAPQPDIDLPPLDHVTTDLDVYMERQIHVRRHLPIAAIADELAGLRPRRLASLRQAASEGDPLVRGPFGERRLSQSLPIRAFDLWMHEQDIRDALGLPLRDNCTAAEIALDRTIKGWQGGLPTKATGIDATMTIDVTGPFERSAEVVLGEGGPPVLITGSVAEVTRLFAGRIAGQPPLVTGDAAVVAALAGQFAMTP